MREIEKILTSLKEITKKYELIINVKKSTILSLGKRDISKNLPVIGIEFMKNY
jgi:hypothetical protein